MDPRVLVVVRAGQPFQLGWHKPRADFTVGWSRFLLGKSEKSARDGILIWCADRLQAVKWRNYKVLFYQQETMSSPAVKLPVPPEPVHEPA